MDERAPARIGRPSLQRGGRWAGALLLVALLAACSGGARTAATAHHPTSTPASTAPVGLIALGHSGLTGEDSDPKHPGAEAKQNSWATGTARGLDSIYQRMIALRPETAGHVANAATGGAPAESLAGQAETALKTVRTPALAIIQTIDDDIQCDGTDAGNLPVFSRAVTAALQVISRASPHTAVLIITQPGRPAGELKGMAQAIRTDPAVRDVYTGSPPCGLLDRAGRPIPADIAALTAIVERYEAAQAKACARFPTCRTDEGALASFIRTPDLVAPDHNHLNSKGQAKLAAAVWPSAETALAQVGAG